MGKGRASRGLGHSRWRSLCAPRRPRPPRPAGPRPASRAASKSSLGDLGRQQAVLAEGGVGCTGLQLGSGAQDFVSQPRIPVFLVVATLAFPSEISWWGVEAECRLLSGFAGLCRVSGNLKPHCSQLGGEDRRENLNGAGSLNYHCLRLWCKGDFSAHLPCPPSLSFPSPIYFLPSNQFLFIPSL